MRKKQLPKKKVEKTVRIRIQRMKIPDRLLQ
jgi:hypothetical protein